MSGTLHLICESAGGRQLADCAQLLGPEDRVVLMGPAVAAAAQITPDRPGVWYVMSDDLAQYGRTGADLPPRVAAIDFEQLLALAVVCSRSLSW